MKYIKPPIFFILYGIVVCSLFLYSFTQIDLGLTLTRLSIWQAVQTSFQYIGYFNRPLSAMLYGAIVLLLFVCYLLFLRLTSLGKITKKQLWGVVIVVSVLLGISYNAFSYDLFNYIFDAKIVTYYGQNPYVHKALDFPGDPMLSFMHWTHRVYPYGPVWLGLSIVLSYVGLHYFIITFFLFKALMVGAFIGTVYFIGKTLQKVAPNNELFGIALFALNPLVLVEGLISAHNDIVMLFFGVAAVYYLVKKHFVWAVVLLLLSIGIKFATLFLVPVFFIATILEKRKQTHSWEITFTLLCMLMSIAVIVASLRTNFQPWYLLYIIPFAALVGKKYYIVIPTVVLSAFALGNYIPFLYLGNWNPPVPTILSWLLFCSLGISLLVTVLYSRRFIGSKK